MNKHEMSAFEVNEVKIRLDHFFQNRPVRPDVVVEFVVSEIEKDRENRV